MRPVRIGCSGWNYWWSDRGEAIGYFRYTRLRLTPDGLRVMGEWPPAEEVNA